MASFTKTANDVFAPTDAAGNVRPVDNQDAQVWGEEVQAAVAAALASLSSVVNGMVIGGAVIYATKAAMDADLAHAANTVAVVYADPTAANNDVYVKIGASGSGSWSATGLTLPSSISQQVSALASQIATKASSTALSVEVAARTNAVAAEATARQAADSSQVGRLTTIETVGLRSAATSRPGEYPPGFTSSTGGAPEIVARPYASFVADSDGRIVRIAGPGIVGSSDMYRIEPGRRYRIRYVFRRRTDSTDPANDAVRLAVSWLTANGDLISGGILQDVSGLLVAQGRQERSFVVATAAGDTIDMVAPAGAVYVRPFAQMFGSSPTTDVEVISWLDISDVEAYSPDLSSLEGRVTAQETIDAGSRLTVLEAAVTAPRIITYETKAAAEAADAPASAVVLRLIGRDDSTDGKSIAYVRAASEPAIAAVKLKTHDGQWWQQITDTVDAALLGGKDDGVFDNIGVMQAAALVVPTGGTIKFRRQSGVGVYYFSAIAPVSGIYLDVEPGVVLKGVFSRPQSPGEVTSAVNHPKVTRRTRVTDMTIGSAVDVWLNPDYIQPLGQKSFFLSEGHLSRPRTELLSPSGGKLSHEYVDWPSGDLWTATAPTSSAGSVQWPAESLNRFRMSFRATKWAEQIDVAFNGDADSYYRAAAVRMASGYYVFWADREATALNIGYKAAGASAVTSAVTIPGAATHDSQKPQWAKWSIQVINPFAFAVLFNGVRVTTIKTASPITHFGFGVYNTTTTPTVLGWRLLRSKQFFGVGPVRISTFGDSTVADIYGGWPMQLRRMLEGSFGIRVEKLTNRGVGGWSAADVLADIQANGINDSSGLPPTLAYLMVGANDIQAATNRFTFIATIEAIIDVFTAAGVPLIISISQMFYSLALGGGTGQNTSNYYFGALYRAAEQQSIATKFAASGLVFEADLEAAKGHILGNYKGSDPLVYDQILRDNIHQTDGGYLLDAFAMARAGADVLAPETTRRAETTALPTANLTTNGSCGYSNSWAAGTRPPEFATDRDGNVFLNGFMSHASYTPSDGELIYTLPASLRPKTAFTRIVDRGSSTLFVRLNIGTDGAIRIYGSLTNITQVDLGGISFARE